MATHSIPLNDADTLLKRLGTRVRSLRKNLSLSRRTLAVRAAVSERYLADLETGKGNVSVRLLNRIATALETSIGNVLNFAEEQSPEENLIMRLVHALSPEDRLQALELLYNRFPVATGTKRRVALVGLRGAGKSTLGQQLADRLKIPFVGLVGVVEGIAGMSVAEIFSLSGESGYRTLEKQALHDTLNRYTSCVIETGGSIVADPKLLDTLLRSCFVVWLRTEPEQYMARVVAQGDLRPMRNRPDAMADLRRLLDDRQPYYSRAHATVDTTGQTVSQSLERLSGCLPSHLTPAGPNVTEPDSGGQSDADG